MRGESVLHRHPACHVYVNTLFEEIYKTFKLQSQKGEELKELSQVITGGQRDS